MGKIALELKSLSDVEIDRVERLLSPDHRTRVPKVFIRSIAADLKKEGTTLKIGSGKSLKGSVAHWQQKVLLARSFRGRNVWKPEAYVKLATRARIVERGKKASIELNVASTAEYFDWLLIRAIANGEIQHFIFCEYCGGIKHMKIVRRDIRFCDGHHRSKFNYIAKTRMGAKNLLTTMRARRPDGWPYSQQDMLILRENGVKHGTKKAGDLLMRASFPIEKLDEVERKTFSEDFQAPKRDLASSSHTVLYVRRNKQAVIISAGQANESSVGIPQLTRQLWHGKVMAAFVGHESDANPLLSLLDDELERSKGNLATAANQLTKDWRADTDLCRRNPMLVIADHKSAVLIQFNAPPIVAKESECAVGFYSDFVEGAAKSLSHLTDLTAKEIARKSMNILTTRKKITGGTLSIIEL